MSFTQRMAPSLSVACLLDYTSDNDDGKRKNNNHDYNNTWITEFELFLVCDQNDNINEFSTIYFDLFQTIGVEFTFSVFTPSENL